MLVDIAKPIALMLCLLTLYAVFFTAFMVPGDPQYRILESLELLALAAGISVVSGLIFRESMPGASVAKARLTTTLPIQVFLWASAIMFCLFLVSWYLETYCNFYQNLYF